MASRSKEAVGCRLLGKMPAKGTKRQRGLLQLQLKHSVWQRRLQRKQVSSRVNRYSVLCMSHVCSASLLHPRHLKKDREATLLAAAAEEEKPRGAKQAAQKED